MRKRLKALFYQVVDLHIEHEVNYATRNRVLLGQLGVNHHLVQLLVVEEHDDLYQIVHTMEVLLLCAMVRIKIVSI